MGASSFVNTESTTARFDSFKSQPTTDSTAEKLSAAENALLDVIAPRRSDSEGGGLRGGAAPLRPIVIKKLVGDASMVTEVGTVKSHAMRRKEIDRQVADFEHAHRLNWGLEHLGSSGPLSPSGLPSKQAPPRRVLEEPEPEPQEAHLEEEDSFLHRIRRLASRGLTRRHEAARGVR